MKAFHAVRRAVAVLAAGAVGIAAAMVAPAPAYAEQLVVVVQRTSEVDDGPKSVTVSCPAGYWVFALGAHVGGNDGKVQLVRMEAAADLRSAIAAARPRADSAAAFSVTVGAVCGRTDHPPTLVTQSVTQEATASAHCPSATNLFGLGFRIERPVGQWRIDALVPDSTLTEATVHAAGAGQAGALTVSGICYTVDLQAPPPYLSQAVSTPEQAWPQTVEVPAGTDWTFGVGARTTGLDTHLDSFIPRPTGAGSARAQQLAAPVSPALARSSAQADTGSMTTYAVRIGTFH